MASFTGISVEVIRDQLGAARVITGIVSSPPPVLTAVKPEVDPFTAFAGGIVRTKQRTARFGTKIRFGGGHTKAAGSNFFGRVYVLPREIAADIILADTLFTLDIYNAFKEVSRDWIAYDDSSAGIGVNIATPIPPPTITIPRLTGTTRVLTVTQLGPPDISGEIDLTFDSVGTITIPITGSRSTLFPYEPENGMAEDLEWKTDILTATKQTEQRRALRKTPRTNFVLSLLLDGTDRSKLENDIFDGHDRAFGIPRWQEATILTTDITALDTSINVATTLFADYRVGGLAVVWEDSDTFETLQIQSIGATTLVFESGFSQNFTAPARVMPVNTGIFSPTIRFRRYRRNLMEAIVNVKVLDNDNDLSDVTAFNSFSGKVFLDGFNVLLSDTIQESMTRDIIIIDNITGTPVQFTGQEVSRRNSSFTFLTTDREGAWNVRQLLHALKGKQISLYMASGAQDFIPVVDVTSADVAIDVSSVGYTNLVKERQPRNIIRIVKTDGTASAPLPIASSSIPSVGVERLSFSPTTAGITATVEEINRVEYVHKIRLNSDKIRMKFEHSSGNMRVSIPTIEVFE